MPRESALIAQLYDKYSKDGNIREILVVAFNSNPVHIQWINDSGAILKESIINL